MKLKLVKIEEGLCRGNVVYHSYVKLSKGEIKAQMDELKKKRDLKAERKRVQDANVKRKQEEAAAKAGKKVDFAVEEAEPSDVDLDEAKDVRALPKKLTGKRRARE